MTSSLVGSEMCIRDRADGALEYSGALVERAGHKDISVSFRDYAANIKPCLLYTSDAADDM
eukprot:3010650-Prorocentrum_lima.AAC.1